MALAPMSRPPVSPDRRREALRQRAQALSEVSPPLLIAADRVAQSLIQGEHGRRRAGPGDDFWQYRPYSFGDAANRIDWRKSARTQKLLIRENEWAATNTLHIWAANGPGMAFRSAMSPVSKRDRAALLAVAAGVIAVRAGERVTALASPHAPGHTRLALANLADWEASGQPPDAVGQERAQVAQGRGRPQFSRRLEPAAERHRHEHHARDLEVDVPRAGPRGPGRLRERRRHAHEQEQVERGPPALQFRERVLEERPGEQDEHGRREQQAGVAGEAVERGRRRARRRALRLRPEQHREHHHVHREEQGHAQPGHHPPRPAILARRPGDRRRERAARAAVHGGSVRGRLHREAAVRAAGCGRHGRWISSTCIAGRRKRIV